MKANRAGADAGKKETSAVLSLSGICKKFSSHQVLTDVSLSACSGQVLGLLGDNGAGKSTLIKIISGFHRPDSGRMTWEGDDVVLSTFNPTAARRMGIQTVYQHLGLVDELSISRNFFLGQELVKKRFGVLFSLDHRKMREIVCRQLDQLGVRRKLNPEDSVASLSGGERQAIAIARARYFGARLLILDEPTSALALRQTREVLNYIRLARDSGVAVIFITHSLHHCKEVADQVVVLHQGRSLGPYPKSGLSDEECSRLIMHGRGFGTAGLEQAFL